MLSDPCVSIVVPCYNVESYVRETLDSLVVQTLSDIEIICVNDGSTDGTLDVLLEYAAGDDRIVVLDGPNGGYGHAMNKGMAAARGRYIGIVESDDYVDVRMFETLYACSEQNDLDFAKADFKKFWTWSNGEVVEKVEHLSDNEDYYNAVLDPSANMDLFNAQMLNWAGIYRTTFIREHGIRHNESPGASYQDNGFWFQVFCQAHRGMFLRETFYHYRQDNESSSINATNKVFCMLDEYAWIRDWLCQNPELEQRFIGIYHYKKMHNLNFAFSLLAEEFQAPFLKRYAREYIEAEKAGELDQKYFGAFEWESLQDIMRDPEGYREKYNDTHRSRQYELEYERARARGKVPAALYILKQDGPLALLKRLK